MPGGDDVGVDTTTTDDTAPVFRLLYRSHDLIGPARRKTELGALFTTARSRNKQLGVTGALLVSDGFFVQVLEGDEAAVRTLFDHIAKDPRHDGVELVETIAATPRVFSRWAMAEVGIDGEKDTPLIAHVDGIAPAAGHRSTPEQTAVLGVMRRMARPAPTGQLSRG